MGDLGSLRNIPQGSTGKPSGGSLPYVAGSRVNAAWIYLQFWYVTGVTKPCFCHNAGHGRFDIARAVISSEALPNLLCNLGSLKGSHFWQHHSRRRLPDRHRGSRSEFKIFVDTERTDQQSEPGSDVLWSEY